MDTAESTSVEPPPPGDAPYDGFISYSHAADDLVAPRLQAGLQKFAKPWWKRRAVRIFRDESSLAANPHLWSSITDALDDSAWFVLLLSEDAASSEWVGNEIEHWTKHKPSDRILPVVTDGTFGWENGDVTGTSVPPALQGVFSEEPRWVDLRFARGEEHLDLQNPDFSAAVADIAATIRGIPKDELASEEVKQHRRTIRTAWAAGITVTILAVAAIVAGVFAIGQRNDARDNADLAEQNATLAQQNADRAETEADRANENAEAEAEARSQAETSAQLAIARELAASAVNVLDTDPELAIRLTLEAIEQTPGGVEQPVEVIDALWKAVQEDRLVEVIDTGSDGNVWIALSGDESLLAASTEEDATLRVMSMPAGIEQWSYTEDTTDSFGMPFISPNNEMVAIGVWDSTTRLTPGGRSPDDLPARIMTFDARNGSPIKTLEYADCPGALGLGWSPAGSYFAVSHFAGPCPRSGVESGSWVEILDGQTLEQVALVDTIETFTPLARFDRLENLYVFGEDGRGVEIYPSPGFRLDRVIEGITNVGNISPDGSLAVTFDPGGRGLGIYDTETGLPVDHLKDVPGFPKSPVTPGFSPDGRHVAMATNAAATAVWDTGTGEQVFTLGGGPGTNATASLDGDRLYTGHSDGTIKVWDLRPAGGLPSVDDLGTHHWINANTFAIGPEIGAAVAIDIGAFDFQMVFFDVRTGSFVGQPIQSWSSPAVALADNRFVLRTFQGEWITFNPMTGEQRYLTGCPVDQTGSLCADTGDPAPEVQFVVSVDGTELGVSIDGSPTVLIDPDTGAELGRISTSLDSVVFFTRNWLAGNTADNVAVVVDRSSGEQLLRITLPQRGRAETSTTGSAIANSSDDGRGVTVTDTTTWMTRTVQVDVGLVRGLSVSPDGSYVALGDENGLHIVDVEAESLVQSVPLPSVSDIHWIDETTVLIGTTNGVWATVPLSTEDLISIAKDNLSGGFTDDECATYRIDPCPTLDEIRVR